MTKKKKAEKAKEETKPKTVVKAIFARERIITESSNDARELYNQSRYGTLLEEGKVQLSLLEALYLVEKGRLMVVSKLEEERLKSVA